MFRVKGLSSADAFLGSNPLASKTVFPRVVILPIRGMRSREVVLRYSHLFHYSDLARLEVEDLLPV